MLILEVHYGGKFENTEKTKLYWWKAYYFDIDPDFMSINELRQILKGLKLPNNIPIRYKDIDGKLVLIRNEDVTYNMWDIFKEEQHVVLYVGPQVDGRQDRTDNAGPESDIGPQVDRPRDGIDNAGPEKGVTNENLVFKSHEGLSIGETSTVQNEDINDNSNVTYSGKSEESIDNGSDLKFFTDGDSLSGTSDPISDDYMEYVARRNGGQIIDDGNVSDPEILEEAYGSSNEDDGLGFREFNEERDMQNPDIVVDYLRQNPIFQRMFVMYSAQKNGFLKGCRLVTGLELCHLKGPYGGYLMHAITRDANNQMYPLAMACMESEWKDSWSWFLGILSNEIGSPLDRHWRLSQIGRRVKDKALRDILWAAAKAYLPDVHYRKMSLLELVDKDAYKCISEIPAHLWARYQEKREWASNVKSKICPGYLRNLRRIRLGTPSRENGEGKGNGTGRGLGAGKRTVRGRGHGGARGEIDKGSRIRGNSGRARNYGPCCGIGLRNSIGISTMTTFFPHSQFSGPSQASRTVQPTFLWPNNQQNVSTTSTNEAFTSVGPGGDPSYQVERQQSRFGTMTFSSQISGTRVHVYKESSSQHSKQPGSF
ncbi:hypothetical protein ACH5RR_028136 [Cinchona calisaya]|uniref:MULE transposase domain-containing protein n=1 Tax=Cinchona calisaya TaxID=153742 RepID=A0ABD2YRW0_9GENT